MDQKGFSKLGGQPLPCDAESLKKRKGGRGFESKISNS